MAHLVVKPHHASFGPMHEDPRTGEPWTPETAAEYRRRCGGTGRSGGIGCDVLECHCDRVDVA